MPDGSESNFERRAALMRASVWSGVRRHAPSVAVRTLRAALWAVFHFAFVLVQQVAELAAPLLLVLGAGWYALPRVVGLVQTSDAQVHDVLNGLAAKIPTELTVAGLQVTPGGLIFDGIALMVVAAALSTATAVLANELYRDR